MAEKRKNDKGFDFSLNIVHNGTNRTIVTRGFNTNEFSNEVRFSSDLNKVMATLVEVINEFYRENDMNHQYQNYNLKDNAFLDKYKKEIRDAKTYKYRDNNNNQ